MLYDSNNKVMRRKFNDTGFLYEDVDPKDLKIGETATIRSGTCKGELVLKAYNVFVSLTNPNNTFNYSETSPAKLKLIKRIN